VASSARPSPIRCWERTSCNHTNCEAYGSENSICWLTEQNMCFEDPQDLLNRMQSRCLTCDVFKGNRDRASGKRLADTAMLATLDRLLAEVGDLVCRVESLKAESRSRMAQVTLLSEVGRALQSTMELDETLRIILTAVTAGDGLGFNRAFLLLVDEQSHELKGRMGVGPTHAAEAEAIWKAMETEGLTLREILRRRKTVTSNGIMKLARELRFPIDAEDNIVAASLIEGKSRIVENFDDVRVRILAERLGSQQIIVVPLVAEDERLGAIVADNFVTNRPITTDDMRLLESFASQAALAIMNASLHQRLRDRLHQLEKAHDELSRKQLQLLRAERLMALAGLAATFVHDVKGPLVSVGLMARAALSGIKKSDPSRATLERIIEEIGRIERYLKELAGSVTHRRDDYIEVDLGEVIRESVDLMKGALSVQHVGVVFDLRHGDARVVGSRTELRQLILSLIQNSLEAMPDGGEITISTSLEDGRMRLVIRDTGSGVPEPVRDKIFSLFFTTKSKGSGLGLFIAKRIVIQHGGTIGIESCEGKGSAFVVSLPIGGMNQLRQAKGE